MEGSSASCDSAASAAASSAAARAAAVAAAAAARAAVGVLLCRPRFLSAGTAEKRGEPPGTAEKRGERGEIALSFGDSWLGMGGARGELFGVFLLLATSNGSATDFGLEESVDEFACLELVICSVLIGVGRAGVEVFTDNRGEACRRTIV